MASSTVTYQAEPGLPVFEFLDLLIRSTLAIRRPTDLGLLQKMLDQADIVLTARSPSGLLVGIARSLSDFSFCTYLSDLAVDQQFQGQKIGRELIHRTHEIAGRHTRLILLAAPMAQSYYPYIGMIPHDSCWMIPPFLSESDAPSKSIP